MFLAVFVMKLFGLWGCWLMAVFLGPEWDRGYVAGREAALKEAKDVILAALSKEQPMARETVTIGYLMAVDVVGAVKL
jgi:hypothetical protein